MKMKSTLAILLCLASAVSGFTAIGKTDSSAGNIIKETIAFAEKDGATMYLDKYELSSAPDSLARPVVLFAFGGGFYTGDRAQEYQIPYFEFLARNGFVVLSTDYRTMLKNLDASRIKSPTDFLDVLQGAIDTAVVDFCDAARYAIDHAAEWNIDPSLIVASGSSAGAITALQAEYDICNGRYTTSRLPEDFNFAGVVSFAGAISEKKKLHWDAEPCPIMLFHGNADGIVPFRKAHIPFLGGLWGSESVAQSLDRLDASCWLYEIDNAGHEIASLPMTRNLYDIAGFLSRQVLGARPLSVHTLESFPGAPDVKKNFSVLDYIGNNT